MKTVHLPFQQVNRNQNGNDTYIIVRNPHCMDYYLLLIQDT